MQSATGEVQEEDEGRLHGGSFMVCLKMNRIGGARLKARISGKKNMNTGMGLGWHESCSRASE